MTFERERPAGPGTVLIAHAGAELYGSDLQLLETVTAFTEAGHRTVVVLPNGGPLVERLGERGATVRIVPFPVVRRKYLSPRGAAGLAVSAAKAHRTLLRLIRSEQAGLVFVNTTIIPWWLAAARHAGVPSICHVHEAEDKDNRAVLVALLSPLLLADAVISISQTATAAMLSAIPRLSGRIHLIHNGVPDRTSGPPVPPPGQEAFRACVLGRLSPRKGVHLALEAVQQLRAGGRNVLLEVAGSPFTGYEWYEEQLRAQAAAPGLAGAVTFSGYVTPSSLVWDRNDAVIAPSLREPFGTAVVEAQLAERPIVAVAAAGHLETVLDGRTGLLAQPDGADIAAKLATLMDDRELGRRLGQAARQRALEEFSPQRYRAQILALAGSLLGQREAGRPAARAA